MLHKKVNKPIIWIALWSWSARGLSHIWILKALNQIWINPDIVCGTSIGSVIWASYVNWNLDKLEQWFWKLTKYEIFKFFNIGFKTSNLIDKNKLKCFFNNYIGKENQNIEKLPKKFWCIATCFDSWKEIDFIKWNLYNSIISSISLPGLFTPYYYNNKLLIDWWVVNPVPVSLCKKLWADIVIAVDLNSMLVSQNKIKNNNTEPLNKDFFKNNIFNNVKKTLKIENKNNNKIEIPSMFKTLWKTIDIMQYKITNNKLIEDTPDFILQPNVSHIWVIDFYKSQESIDMWFKCVINSKIQLQKLINKKNIK